MPSKDRIVAEWSASVTAQTACPTQSTLVQVDNANWNGAQASFTSLQNCRANVFTTNRRNIVPVAIPQTPPSLLFNVVIDANMNEQIIVSSTDALTKSCAAVVTENKISRSSKQTRKIFFVQPPGPEELCEGALWRHVATNLESNSNSCSGTKLTTSSGFWACCS